MSIIYQNQVNLTDIIGPGHYGLHWDIVDGNHTHYILQGGRGSLKSSTAGVEVVLGIIEDVNANAICFRKVGNTLRNSVYEQILWAIAQMQLSMFFKCTTNPMQCVYKPTEQKIMFSGLDDPLKVKSIKCSRGYFKILWFEEFAEFAGEEEIRSVQQSVMRGGSKFIVIKSYNPPISRSNWANKHTEEQKGRDDTLVHESSYLDAPPEWLGQAFLDEAEHLKEVNPRAYEHEYLGVPVGTGTNIFEFLEIRTITDDEIKRFDRIYQGVDWGWYPDPFAFVRSSYLPSQEKIYFIDEYGGNKITNTKSAQEIIDRGYDDYPIIEDSAEPKSINDHRSMGLPARAAIKGPGSVEYGMKWLQGKTLVIDPVRTPDLYKEVIEYEHDVDKNGNVMSGYPDRNNHRIDATRYSYEPFYNRKGNRA